MRCESVETVGRKLENERRCKVDDIINQCEDFYDEKIPRKISTTFYLLRDLVFEIYIYIPQHVRLSFELLDRILNR